MKLALRGLYPRWLARPAWQRAALCALALGAIAFVSFLPVGGSSSLPDATSFLLNWGHQFLYGALAVALAAAAGLDLGRPRWAARAGVVALVALAGILDELHQGATASRQSSLWDLGSDILGAILALTAAGWTARRAGPVLEAGPVLFCLGLSLAWNCVPAFLPGPSLPELLP